MALFDDITKKAAKFTEGAIDKTQELAGVAKLKLKMKNLESDLDDVYVELGKRYFQQLDDQDVIIDMELENMCRQVRDYKLKIEDLERQIESQKTQTK